MAHDRTHPRTQLVTIAPFHITLRCVNLTDLLHPPGTIKTIRVPFESTLSRAINTGLQDLHHIRRMRSLLAPFTDSAVTASTSAATVACSSAELGDRLGKCIMGFQSIQGLHRGLRLIRAAKLPSALIAELVATLRTAYTEMADKEKETNNDDSTTTSAARHASAEEDLQQKRMAFTTFETALRTWELQLQAHKGLMGMATSPLQLLLRSPSAPSSDAIDKQCLADKLFRIAGDAIAADYPASEHNLNIVFSRWITFFPETPSPEPTAVEVSAMQTYIDASCGARADGAHGDSPHMDVVPDAKLADDEVLQMAQFCFQPILSGCCSVERLRDTLWLLHLGPCQLIDLFVVWVCSLPLWCVLHEAVATHLFAVLRALVVLPDPFASASGSSDACTAPKWCALIRSRCALSDRCAQAFVVAVLGQSVWHSTRVIDSDANTAEHWCVLRHRLHDALVLSLALAVRGTRAVSVNNLLKPGRLLGVLIPHLVGLQTSHRHITDSVAVGAEALLDALRKQPVGDGGAGETAVEDRRNPAHHVAFLRTRFPHMMTEAALALRLSSAYLDQWIKDRTEGAFALLTAVECICASNNAYVSTAACLALWQHHLRGDFKKLVNLIEKVKKAPKERLCVKEVGMEARATTKFAEATALALEHLHTSTIAIAAHHCGTDRNNTSASIVVCDARWTQVPSESKRSDAHKEELFFGQLSLTELMSHAAELQVDILGHHKALGRVIYFILKFQMRSVKPLSLFLDHVKGMLFAPFTVEHPDKNVVGLDAPAAGAEGDSGGSTTGVGDDVSTAPPRRVTSVPQVYEDPNQAAAAANAMEVRSARRQFLMQALGESVARRGQHVSAVSDDTATARVFELASWFGLEDDDKLRRYYVCHLFHHGWAADAQEVLSAVVDTVVMASMLLDLAIRELAEQLDPDQNPEALALTSKLPGYVYEWCKAAAYVPAGTFCGARPPSSGTPGGKNHIDNVINIVESAVPLATDRCDDRDRILRLHAALVDLPQHFGI